MKDYDAKRPLPLGECSILVDGEVIPHVFEFSVKEKWVRAFNVDSPCPACGSIEGGKHLRWWSDARTQEWEPGPGKRIFPAHPKPEGCWFELGGEIQLLDPDGVDVTGEYLQGLVQPRSAA